MNSTFIKPDLLCVYNSIQNVTLVDKTLKLLNIINLLVSFVDYLEISLILSNFFKTIQVLTQCVSEKRAKLPNKILFM